MTQRDKGVPCVLCGFGPDTGIHLPALTGPRKSLPYGHEYYGPHVVVLQDPPLNVFANWPQSDRDANALPQRVNEPAPDGGIDL